MITVSIVVPCYNEEATIFLLLEAIHKQSFPHEQMEVIIADGLSSDQTRREIARFQGLYPTLRIQVVDNPKRIIPAALNCAIGAACGEYILRLDAHCMPYPNYVEQSLLDLQAGLGDNVGGVWEIQPRNPEGKTATWIAEGIAAASAHPLGVGDALYRFAVRAQIVDTVPFGSFRRELFQQLGGFNEDLLTNEDYEFNQRLRLAGGKIWLDPAIRSIYFARPTLADLIRQYWRYGYWKGRMLMHHPNSLRWRQALPVVFIASLVILLICSIFWGLARWLLILQIGAYLLILTGAGIQVAMQRMKNHFLLSVPLAIACMHLTWGAGVLFSLMQSTSKNLMVKKSHI